MMITLLFLGVLASAAYAQPVILNSCENCVTRKEYDVGTKYDYFVQTNPTVDTCKWECSVRFYSTKNNSWLCLAQVGLRSLINDSNSELFIYVDKDNPMMSLKYYPDTWGFRELCKQTNLIDFSLKKVNPNLMLDFRKLHVDLKVLDIESTGRTAYFDGSYCGTEYLLLNSEVSVYNQPEQHNPVTYDQTLTFVCGIQITRMEENSDKKICFLYIPSDQVDCGSNWTFSVSKAGYTLEKTNMVYTLNCSEKKVHEMVAWCADTDLHQVTLVFQRARNVVKSAEHPKMFRFVFFDYSGTNESLMQEKASQFKGLIYNPHEDDTSSNVTFILIISAGVICFLVTVALALVCIKKHNMACVKYIPVRSPKTQNDFKNGPRSV